MIPVHVAQERNTRNAAGSTKRRHRGAHRMVTVQRDIAEIKTDLEILKRSDLHMALMVGLVVAIAVAALLAKVFNWI